MGHQGLPRGITSRRLSVLIVLFWSPLVGLGGVVVWIAVTGAERPGTALLWAGGAGIAGALGLGCLYRGMAVGAIGIVAPISATSPRLSQAAQENAAWATGMARSASSACSARSTR